jgi:polyhydroxyalkanoate synthesis regulator phasin
MASNERIRKYLEAGAVLQRVNRARAEEIVRELVSAGDIQREQAKEWVDNLVERSRKSSEEIIDMVRREVASQLSKVDAKHLEHLAGRVSDLLKSAADAGRSAAHDASKAAQKETAKAAKVGRDAAKKGREAARNVVPKVGKKKTAAKKAAKKKAAAAKKAPAKKKAAGAKKAAKKAAS